MGAHTHTHTHCMNKAALSLLTLPLWGTELCKDQLWYLEWGTSISPHARVTLWGRGKQEEGLPHPWVHTLGLETMGPQGRRSKRCYREQKHCDAPHPSSTVWSHYPLPQNTQKDTARASLLLFIGKQLFPNPSSAPR